MLSLQCVELATASGLKKRGLALKRRFGLKKRENVRQLAVFRALIGRIAP